MVTTLCYYEGNKPIKKCIFKMKYFFFAFLTKHAAKNNSTNLACFNEKVEVL